MALSRFPAAFDTAAVAVLDSAQRFKALRDQGGDLTWRALESAQDSLRSAKIAALSALTEAAKASDKSAVEAFMASMDGPATLAEFQAALGAVEAASSAWNDTLTTFLAGLPNGDLIGVSVQDTGLPTETRHITRPHFIPAERAASLRSSPDLNALVKAFEAVGA